MKSRITIYWSKTLSFSIFLLAVCFFIIGHSQMYADEAVSQGEEPLPPYFTNVSSDVHLTSVPGFRLSIADLNGDGYPDILLHRQLNHSTGDVLDKQYLYLNVQGDNPPDPYSRKFIDYTTESGIRAYRPGRDGKHSDSAVFADVDNDGDLDMFTVAFLHDYHDLNEGTNDLMLNDGEAHFTLAPNSPFHNEPIYNTAGAVFVEYNNDGYVDIFIGNYYCEYTGQDWCRDNLLEGKDQTIDQLYQGHGDGTFTNVTASAGIDARSSVIFGIAAFDWNNDGYTDLFVPPYAHTSWDSVPIHWMNNGNGTFTQVQSQTNYDDYRGTLSFMASFGSMPRDFDNDGDTDFFELLTHGEGDGDGSVHSTAVANVDEVFSWDFYRVDGRAAEDPDITHHGDHYASWFDFDNDGLVDFVLTESGYSNNRIYLFKQASDNTFSPVTVASGLNVINDANLPPHNAMALDYDLDGDEDLLIGFGNDTDSIQLWRNDVGTDNNWITVTLEGAGKPGKSNRSAIGARVEVTAGSVTQSREVYAGPGHHGPQMPLSLSFGLGSASLIDSITVYWPNQDQTTTTLTNVSVNQFLTLGDPANLMLEKDGADVILTWDDSALPGLTWNIYREENPDPSTWGPAHSTGVSDQDPGTPGIQYRDAGAVSTGASYYYFVTIE